jgi:RNAse (barnase) inhibitor barstar
MHRTLTTWLATGSSSGLYQWPEVSVSTSDLRAATEAGWTVAVVRLASVRTKAELFGAFQRDLSLPDWFGHNWDALVDALADWAESSTHRLLVIEDAGEHDHGYPIEPLTDVITAATTGQGHFVVLVTAAQPLTGVRHLA